MTRQLEPFRYPAGSQRWVSYASRHAPPPTPFPEVEDIGWRAIHGALCGRLTSASAVTEIQRPLKLMIDG